MVLWPQIGGALCGPAKQSEGACVGHQSMGGLGEGRPWGGFSQPQIQPLSLSLKRMQEMPKGAYTVQARMKDGDGAVPAA